MHLLNGTIPQYWGTKMRILLILILMSGCSQRQENHPILIHYDCKYHNPVQEGDKFIIHIDHGEVLFCKEIGISLKP